MISDSVYETAIAERDAARAELSDRDNQYREACACWRAAEAERDEYRASAEDLGKGIEVCWDEIAKLKALLVQHHALDAMSGAMVGDRCPVCAAEKT